MTRLRTLLLLRIARISAAALFIVTAAARPAAAQVTAVDVVDRPTLRAFVERARDHAEASIAGATEQEAYDFFDREFRPEGEWRRGPIYTGVILAEGDDRGTSFFHAVAPELEGQNLWDLKDKNEVYIVRELTEKAGVEFVEYYWDNPDVVGDEEEGSLKVGWTEKIEIAGRMFTIGAGFYPATPVPIAPPAVHVLLAALLAAGGAYLRRRRR